VRPVPLGPSRSAPDLHPATRVQPARLPWLAASHAMDVRLVSRVRPVHARRAPSGPEEPWVEAARRVRQVNRHRLDPHHASRVRPDKSSERRESVSTAKLEKYPTPVETVHGARSVPLRALLERPVVPRYSSTPGSAVCSYCSAGQQSVNGVCVSCPAGQTSAPGSAICVDCPAGQTSLAGGACTYCAAGQTSVAGGACTACPPGQTSVAGSSSCINCPAGYVVSPAGDSCNYCPLGQI
jgi:hypothetical protein